MSPDRVAAGFSECWLRARVNRRIAILQAPMTVGWANVAK
jgi:hypothetical protein